MSSAATLSSITGYHAIWSYLPTGTCGAATGRPMSGVDAGAATSDAMASPDVPDPGAAACLLAFSACSASTRELIVLTARQKLKASPMQDKYKVYRFRTNCKYLYHHAVCSLTYTGERPSVTMITRPQVRQDENCPHMAHICANRA